jgi:hypothetical protein
VSNGGVVSVAGTLQVGGGSNAVAMVNLGAGGTIEAPAVVKAESLATATLNASGGTLKANGSSATYLEGLDAVNLTAGGLTVDTDGNDLTINAEPAGWGWVDQDGRGHAHDDGTLERLHGTTLVNGGTLEAKGSFSGSVSVGARNHHARALGPLLRCK